VTYADRYRADDPDRKFLQSREWRERIRPRQLSRQPLCEHCKALERTVIAEHVDHVQRPRGDHRLQRDFSNFQSLCVTCHGRKSKWERSGTKQPLYIGTRADGWIVEAPGGRIESPDRFADQPTGERKCHKPVEF
jgi:5-methylcytosine-specific restriction enzyme A